MIAVVYVDEAMVAAADDTHITGTLIGAALYILGQGTLDDRPELAKSRSVVIGHSQGNAAVEAGNPARNGPHPLVILGMVEGRQLAVTWVTDNPANASIAVIKRSRSARLENLPAIHKRLHISAYEQKRGLIRRHQ